MMRSMVWHLWQIKLVMHCTGSIRHSYSVTCGLLGSCLKPQGRNISGSNGHSHSRYWCTINIIITICQCWQWRVQHHNDEDKEEGKQSTIKYVTECNELTKEAKNQIAIEQECATLSNAPSTPAEIGDEITNSVERVPQTTLHHGIYQIKTQASMLNLISTIVHLLQDVDKKKKER